MLDNIAQKTLPASFMKYYLCFALLCFALLCFALLCFGESEEITSLFGRPKPTVKNLQNLGRKCGVINVAIQWDIVCLRWHALFHRVCKNLHAFGIMQGCARSVPFVAAFQWHDKSRFSACKCKSVNMGFSNIASLIIG